jgi:hypothetical protein
MQKARVSSKKRRITLLLSAAIALLLLRALDRAYFGPPIITITNHSSNDISDVALTGDHFVKSVGRIQAGASKAVVVRPRGESGLQMEFLANGQRIAKDDLAYIEAGGGYCVTLEIDAHLKVETVEDSLCFSLQRSLRLW